MKFLVDKEDQSEVILPKGMKATCNVGNKVIHAKVEDAFGGDGPVAFDLTLKSGIYLLLKVPDDDWNIGCEFPHE